MPPLERLQLVVALDLQLGLASTSTNRETIESRPSLARCWLCAAGGVDRPQRHARRLSARALSGIAPLLLLCAASPPPSAASSSLPSQLSKRRQLEDALPFARRPRVQRVAFVWPSPGAASPALWRTMNKAQARRRRLWGEGRGEVHSL